jgi:hypothetical protein
MTGRWLDSRYYFSTWPENGETISPLLLNMATLQKNVYFKKSSILTIDLKKYFYIILMLNVSCQI